MTADSAVEAQREVAAITAGLSARRKDPHPLVRRAVVWAHDRLNKDHVDGR